jgi:hypothetical protein
MSNSLELDGESSLVGSNYNINEGSFSVVVYDIDGNEYVDIVNMTKILNLQESKYKHDNSEEDIFEFLNKSITYAKYKGVIKDIKIYYTSDLDTYHISIQRVIKKYLKNIKTKTTDITNKENVNIQYKIEPGTRIKKQSIEENEVLIIFEIVSEIDASIGDKFVVDNALKTVVGETIDYELKTKSGIKLDGCFGAKNLFNRIVLSPIKLGILENILKKIEDNAISLYFNKENK